MFRKIPRPLFFLLALLLGASFFPNPDGNAPDAATSAAPCNPNATRFRGYSFLRPEIVDLRSAYAPFFMEWDDYYAAYFDTLDWQKKDNVEEWAARFCDLPDPKHVEQVVYKVSARDLQYLREATVRKKGSTELAYPFEDNSFAQCIVYNGCTEVVDYLLFARKCEDYAVAKSLQWRREPVRLEEMQLLIREGSQRLNQSESHFVRIRYWYQIIRLAHYAGQWGQVVGLYNEFEGKINRQRRPSIMQFWVLGHVAGALQKMGRYADAAYRYGQVFRHCVSKRSQAFRSFVIRNDADWEGALRLCQHDEERATLYLLRAARYRTTAVQDMEQVYELDAANPQLPLVLVSIVQELEKVLLRTPMTDQLFGKDRSILRQEVAANQLIDLQKLVRRAVADGKANNLSLWRSMDGYLEILAGDYYAAEQTFRHTERQLTDNEYDTHLREQIEIWRTVGMIRQLDTGKVFNYPLAASIPTMAVFKKHPAFEPFLRDYVAHYYAESRHPGKAALAAYQDLRVLLYNPDLALLEDLLREGRMGNQDYLDMAAKFDTSTGRRDLYAVLLEVKGMALLNANQPEAALLTLREIDESHRQVMKVFYPFLDTLFEKPHLQPAYSTPLGDMRGYNLLQFVEKLFSLELEAKSGEAVGDTMAAVHYFRLGLGYYNTSWFGYEWEIRDFLRTKRNWMRLAQGPVFPHPQAPFGNRENLDVEKARQYFGKALELAPDKSLLAARSMLMLARCEQKKWFCSPTCSYKPGSKIVPMPPPEVARYYDLFLREYGRTAYGQRMVRECKWLGAYASGR
jgi:hypothetical protein